MFIINFYTFFFCRVNIGLFCTTPGVALARAVPRKVAMQMLLTGYPISADGKTLCCTWLVPSRVSLLVFGVEDENGLFNEGDDGKEAFPSSQRA